MTVQIATVDDAFRARNPTEDEVDGPIYVPTYLEMFELILNKSELDFLI